MNPAALQGEPGRPAQAARRSSSTPTTSPTRNLTKAGYAANPLEDDSLDELRTSTPVDLTGHDRRGGQGVRAVPQGRRPRQEHVRPRAAVVDVRPPDRDARSTSSSTRFAKVADIRDANITAFKAGLELRRDHRGVRGPYEIKPAPMAAGHLPQHLRQPGAGLRPGRRRARSPGCRCSSGSYPITPASDILHELSKHKRVRRHDVPGRGRDRRHRRRARRVVRRLARRHHDLRARASR